VTDNPEQHDPLAALRLTALRILRDSGEFPEGVRWEASSRGLTMQASPDWEHAKILTGLRHALEPVLPAGILVLEGVAFVVGTGVERTPDLVVLDPSAQAEFRDGHAVSASGVLLFVEVTSRGTRSVDLAEKPGEYARAGVPVTLVVDRQAHDVLVHFEPDKGRYRYTETVRAGEHAHLPEPVRVELDTAFLLEHL